MRYKLYLKTSPSGKKYLGKFTERKDGRSVYQYKGSGVYWLRHLEYNNLTASDIETEILYETDSFDDFKKEAIKYSKLWEVSTNEEFANLVDETGDGDAKRSKRGWKNEGTSKACKERVGFRNPMFGKSNLGVSKRMKGLTGYKNPSSKEVFQYDKEGNFLQKFGSTREASRILKVDQGSISLCCRGKIKTAGGYTWKYS
jgi:hypothetical protein